MTPNQKRAVFLLGAFVSGASIVTAAVLGTTTSFFASLADAEIILPKVVLTVLCSTAFAGIASSLVALNSLKLDGRRFNIVRPFDEPRQEEVMKGVGVIIASQYMDDNGWTSKTTNEDLLAAASLDGNENSMPSTVAGKASTQNPQKLNKTANMAETSV